MKKIILKSLVVAMMGLSGQVSALTSLEDQELSEVNGQALLSMEVQSGFNQMDNLGATYDQSNISFYKLGLEAEMEINANIKKLQLGCGGVNGATGCDIDIDHIALSGNPTNGADRAATSALITNPFVQFAIKNPNQASTREVLGFRLSAEKISGLLTMGTENSATPNGINSFSGYMKTKSSSGVATTAPRVMDYAATGMNIEGTVKGTILGQPLPLDLHYTSSNYAFQLNSTTAPFTIPATIVSGTRMKEVVLKGTGTVGRIDFKGPLKAELLDGALKLDKDITGYLTGLQTDITVKQNLGLIHALYLNNPASLSLQSQSILWPGAAVAAKQGWWLAMEDEVDLGSISPSYSVPISDAVLNQTIAGINHDLTTNVRDCGSLVFGCVLGSALDVKEIKNPALLDFPLTNLTLQGQNFKPNCFGGHKFC